ncbi:MAG: flagellar hook-length control protein FliK [Rubellimicrobium sp.]|nr:flagellar hook-length control protein FliK [Rubellimicrobium sp.]
MAPPGQEGGSPASPTRGQRASLPEAPGADLARAPATRAKAAALAEKERFASIAAESVYPRESGHAPAARVLLGVNPPALMADPAGADPSGVGSAGAGPRVPATHADVGRQMRLALGSGTDGATEIRLDPPELGSLRLALHSSTSGLTLAIEVERAGTLDLVRRGIEGLAAELRSLGYDRVEITIDSGNAGARGGGAGTSGFPARADPGPDDRANIPTPAILSVPLSARRPDGGLDLRL